MTTQTPGVSAMVLHRQIGVHYETAYMILQRLRAATVNPLRTKLSGTVEVDETYVSAGRPRRTRWPIGRGTQKPLVVAAVETSGESRIRLRRVDKANKRQLGRFVSDHVEEGSTVITDGWGGYVGLGKAGFHHVVVEGETKEDIARQIPRVHLQAYLNEYAFRRDARSDPQAAFLRILQIGMHREGPEYEGIYGAGEPDGWKHPNPPRKRRKKRA
jgi:transposase-like protein